jgi:hypothetical protein
LRGGLVSPFPEFVPELNAIRWQYEKARRTPDRDRGVTPGFGHQPAGG